MEKKMIIFLLTRLNCLNDVHSLRIELNKLVHTNAVDLVILKFWFTNDKYEGDELLILKCIRRHNSHYTIQQKKKSCLSEFFRQKVSLWPENIFQLVGLGEKIALLPPSFELRLKSQILAILALAACCVQHWTHSRASASVQLASLEFSDPFYEGGSIRKSQWGPGGTIQEHLL